MASEEAAAYATSIFIDVRVGLDSWRWISLIHPWHTVQIALQAQSRKCKLYPSASDYTSSLLSYTPAPTATRSALVRPHENEPPLRRKESSKWSAQYSALNINLILGPELLDQIETKQSVKHHIVSPAKGNKIIEALHTKEPGPSTSSECLSGGASDMWMRSQIVFWRADCSC